MKSKQVSVLKFTSFIFVFLILTLCLVFVSCGNEKGDSETINYTVSFKVGKDVFHTEEIASGNTIVFPDEPQKEGYRFLGWEDSDGNFVDENRIITSDITLIASFKEDTYKVIFRIDSSIYRMRTVPSGSTVQEISAPNEKNMKFDGWMKGDTLFDFSTPILEDTTLDASYSPLPVEECTFTVTYSLGGTNLISTEVKGGEDANYKFPFLQGYLYVAEDIEKTKNITENTTIRLLPTEYYFSSIDLESESFTTTYKGSAVSMGDSNKLFLSDSSTFSFTANFDYLVSLELDLPAPGSQITFHVEIDGVEVKSTTLEADDTNRTILGIANGIEAGVHQVTVSVSDLFTPDGYVIDENNCFRVHGLFLWTK